VKELSLPAYSYKLKHGENGQHKIYDPIRRRYVALTPEEWVRQHFINYMVNSLGYPAALLGVEVMFSMNSLRRRVDIMACNRLGNPLLAVECKAPAVKITPAVFDQLAEYNMKFRLTYLVVTNGITHYACHIDWEKGSYIFLDGVPDYSDLIRDKTDG
jgi:hypothetical protein